MHGTSLDLRVGTDVAKLRLRTAHHVTAGGQDSPAPQRDGAPLVGDQPSLVQVWLPSRASRATVRPSATPSFSTAVGNVGGGHAAAIRIGQPGTTWHLLGRVVTATPPGQSGPRWRTYYTLQWVTLVRSDYKGFVAARYPDEDESRGMVHIGDLAFGPEDQYLLLSGGLDVEEEALGGMGLGSQLQA